MTDDIKVNNDWAKAVLERVDGSGTVRIGEEEYPFLDFASTSLSYRSHLDQIWAGASNAPECTIHDAAGEQVAHVSYNGRIWAGERSFRNYILIHDATQVY